MPLPLSEQVNLDGKKKAEFVKQLHEKVKMNIEEKNKMFAKHANKGRKKLIFNEGDLVWVHLRKERFPKERKSKLMPRMDGPFQVTKRINNNAYQIDLQGKYNISQSFNVADLSPFIVDEADLRTNLFQEGGDDMSMTTTQQQAKEIAEELVPEEALEDLNIITGPMTRSKTKKLIQAIGLLVPKLTDQLPSSAYHTTMVVIQAKEGW